MREDLTYPRADAIRSVLQKIGVQPSTRFDCLSQDAEYTTCMLDELEQYIELYEKSDTTIYEKRVLGCYFLESLNEYFQLNGSPHPKQEHAFRLLHYDKEVYGAELEYWTDTSDPIEDNWWPITKEILTWRATQPGSPPDAARR